MAISILLYRLSAAVKDSWISRADSVFNQCMSSPGVFAFLLDQWSLLLEAQHQHASPGGSSAASGGGAAAAAAASGAAADGPAPPPQIPATMRDWMHEKVNVSAATELRLVPAGCTLAGDSSSMLLVTLWVCQHLLVVL